jgi:hypothetical protein
MKKYCGIDLGKKGGIVIIKDNKTIFRSQTPNVGNEVDWDKIIAILIEHKVSHIVIEKFSGFFGYAKRAAVSLATQSGYLRGILKVLKIPYTEVSPRSWQADLFKDARVQKKSKVDENGKTKQVTDTKKTALMVAKRLFPQETFLATERSKKPHDGIVDAYLLAEYGRRRRL